MEVKKQKTSDDVHINKIVIVESFVNNDPGSSIAEVFNDPALEAAFAQELPEPKEALPVAPLNPPPQQHNNHHSDLNDHNLLRAALEVLVEPSLPAREINIQIPRIDHQSNHQFQQGQNDHPHIFSEQQCQQEQLHPQQQQPQRQPQQLQNMYYSTHNNHSDPSVALNISNLNGPTANVAHPAVTRDQVYLPPQIIQQTENKNSSTQLFKRPTFVNAKQYDRILKRREARSRLENYFAKARKNIPGKKRTGEGAGFVHMSRHKHAMKRPRGPKGRFLTKEELVEYYKTHPEENPN
jgi:hypothetical protein